MKRHKISVTEAELRMPLLMTLIPLSKADEYTEQTITFRNQSA